MVPLSSPLADHLFSAVQTLTSRLDIAGGCEAVLTVVEAVFGATSTLHAEMMKLGLHRDEVMLTGS